MTRRRTQHTQQIGRVLGRLATDRKKTALAFSLVFLMGFMWFRVLTGQEPGPAAAASKVPQESQPSGAMLSHARFFTLPEIPGRHDSIRHDFFAGQDWEPFRESSSAQSVEIAMKTQATPANPDQEVTMRVAQKLKLEAVMWSENPQAFINDELLRVGDRLIAKDGSDTREFEVLRIFEESVLIGCNEMQLTLKMAQYLDVSK